MASTLYLDTNIFITAYEASGERSTVALHLFDALARGEFVAVTSELTLAELLPKPLALGQVELAAFYDQLLSSEPIKLAPVTRRVLLEAARQRARDPSLKVADAIHLATAAQQGCLVFLTGDRRLRSTAARLVMRLDPQTLEQLRGAPPG